MAICIATPSLAAKQSHSSTYVKTHLEMSLRIMHTWYTNVVAKDVVVFDDISGKEGQQQSTLQKKLILDLVVVGGGFLGIAQSGAYSTCHNVTSTCSYVLVIGHRMTF